jgi:hypothetical protein
MTFDEYAKQYLQYKTSVDYAIAKAAWYYATIQEREECIQACLAERLSCPTDSPGDMAYEQAITDCVEAIRKHGEK